MIVTFISECEKKALIKTRRVLDSFANRIGCRTWQTVITQEGLDAVRKLLRKSASKNTAVTCHWIRSHNHTELMWIVGNRNKFNHLGHVPVNSTQQPIINTQWEDDWHYLPLVKSLAALAALFHDWGKASAFFQQKLKNNKIVSDPLRHEWVSLLFLTAYIDNEQDEQWLKRLAAGEFDIEQLKTSVNNYIGKTTKPFHKLSDNANAALLLSWLIVTHHRLPEKKTDANNKIHDGLKQFLKPLSEKWNYYNEKATADELKQCFIYDEGLACDSKVWLKAVKKQASRLLSHLPLLERSINDNVWRAILLQARLALILGDHYYSSLPKDDKNRVANRELKVYANTERIGSKKQVLKQTLDEHLVGVAKQAERTAYFLPIFSGKLWQNQTVLEFAHNIKSLKKQTTDKRFKWQDQAVNIIKRWRRENTTIAPYAEVPFGFFVVNMASTGTGKTIANAKIMQALSVDGDSLRYVLALGLRTLTLQTGDEYRERIGLKKDELAVLIGSKAVQALHEHNKQEHKQGSDELTDGGSESSEDLLANDLDFESSPLLDDLLKTVLRRDKDRQFLYSPVLTCTIDHLMAATESKGGGRHILPTLRLMYSDLVIDEIDDFTGDDLVAIGRLIHLAGMLGGKVILSSATIPPDLAEGYFNAYQAGWRIFAKMYEKPMSVGCAWIDEFKTTVKTIQLTDNKPTIENYQQCHHQFIKQRLSQLAQQVVKRKAEIIPIEQSAEQDEQSKSSVQALFFQTIQKAIIKQHKAHAIQDKESGKYISIGLVRVANIKPCIELTRYLLNADWDNNSDIENALDIRAMAYHSQQLLIMRSAQEKYLDEVLKRKKGQQAALDNEKIRQHINNTQASHLIFILVATPVEEVGRDHCFDWAVVEPSSYRSLVQLAGRVLRHQVLNESIKKPNIAVLQYNRRALLGLSPVFTQPGYETKASNLASHDLQQLLDRKALAEKLDASLRISRNKELKATESLIDLEHQSIHELLTNYNEKESYGNLQGWLNTYWWLTAMPQKAKSFRNIQKTESWYFYPRKEGQFNFVMKYDNGKNKGKATDVIESTKNISQDDELTSIEQQRLWLKRDYEALLLEQDKNLEAAALCYGEINIPIYHNDNSTVAYEYNEQLGMLKK
jgi:CRISPR-associated endonuclease/helicase Cas3